jgi:DNA-binding NtrC family response regulator
MPHTSSRTIWFIDDEPYYTRPYRDALRRAEYQVRYFETMQAAIDSLRSWDNDMPSALVVDIQMPRPEEMSDGDMLEYHDSPGLWFILKRAAQTFQVRAVPIMILTQRDPGPMEPLFKQIRDRHIKLVVNRKIETPAKDLPGLLDELLAP